MWLTGLCCLALYTGHCYFHTAHIGSNIRGLLHFHLKTIGTSVFLLIHDSLHHSQKALLSFISFNEFTILPHAIVISTLWLQLAQRTEKRLETGVQSRSRVSRADSVPSIPRPNVSRRRTIMTSTMCTYKGWGMWPNPGPSKSVKIPFNDKPISIEGA